MSTFIRFGHLPTELRFMIWEEALREEAESRYVLVHRTSMKVLPHKTSNRTALSRLSSSHLCAWA